MKKITITKKSAQTRVANLIVSAAKNALSFMSEPAKVEINERMSSDMYKVIYVKNENNRMLTFTETDSVREALEKYEKKYHGIGCYMDTEGYLARDNKTWLSQPVMVITIKKYDEDIFNK